MGTSFAATTTVTSDRSRAEIEQLLRRYGASAFAYGWDKESRCATIMFEVDKRRVRFQLPLPDPNERRFTHTSVRGYRRTVEAREAEYEQAIRQRWRALTLVIRAKLEAVTAGITTTADEFLASTVMPTGATVGEWLQPQLERAYTEHRMPALLPSPGEY